MPASASNFARRCSLRQAQGRTPLSLTNSHPVPEQDEQMASGLVLSHRPPSRDASGARSFATAYSEGFLASSIDIFLLLLTPLASERLGQLARLWRIFGQDISSGFGTHLGQR